MRKAAHDRLIVLYSEHRPLIPQDKWDRMDSGARVEALTGQSLDNCRAILDMPMEMAVTSPNVMSGKVQVIRALLNAVTRVGLESRRLHEMRDEVLGELIADFDKQVGGSLDTEDFDLDEKPNGHSR